jgi:hypothetical protein
MFLIPYILVLITIELAGIIFLLTYSNPVEKPKQEKSKRKETFNGFYVDR